MKPLCDCCGNIEEMVFPPDNLMQFECWCVSKTTIEDLWVLFKKYGGKR